MESFTWTPPPAPHDVSLFCRLVTGIHLNLSAQTKLELPSGSGFWFIGVTEGSLSTVFEDHPFVLSAGAAIGFSSNSPFPAHTEQSVSLIAILISGQAVTHILGTALSYSPYFPNGCAALSEQIYPLLHLAHEGHPSNGAAASASVFTLLTHLSGTSAPPETARAYPPLIQHAIAIMQQDFAHLYGIEDLAQRLEVSPSHLIRKFSAAVGISPGQYLTQVRIHFAKRLLRSGTISLELVATCAGFSNASYFGKVFRRITGMSPSAYIRTAPPLPLSDLPELYL